MRKFLPLLLLPSLALASDPAGDTPTDVASPEATAELVVPAEGEPAGDGAPAAPVEAVAPVQKSAAVEQAEVTPAEEPGPVAEAAPLQEAAPVQEAVTDEALHESLRATKVELVDLPSDLTATDLEALASIRTELEQAAPRAKEALAQANRLVSKRQSDVKVARLELSAAKAQVKAAKSALKAYEANPDGGDGAGIRGKLDGAERGLVAAKLALAVSQGELAWARTQQDHAKSVITETDLKTSEVRARIDGAEDEVVNKLEKARIKASKAEAKARNKASRAKLKLERVRSRG